MLTPQGVAASIDVASQVAWLYLVTLTDPSGHGTPVRIVNNNESIVSNGESYEPYPFEITLSADDGERVPDVQIRFMHFGGTIAYALRHFHESPHVNIRLVLSVTPDDVEREVADATIATVRYDAMEATARLRLVNALDSASPGPNYGAGQFPGLFA